MIYKVLRIKTAKSHTYLHPYTINLIYLYPFCAYFYSIPSPVPFIKPSLLSLFSLSESSIGSDLGFGPSSATSSPLLLSMAMLRRLTSRVFRSLATTNLRFLLYHSNKFFFFFLKISIAWNSPVNYASLHVSLYNYQSWPRHSLFYFYIYFYISHFSFNSFIR